MMIGSLIAKLAAKSGLNINDPKFAAILGIQTEIPDEDANRISSTLITIDDAKQNPDIKGHFFSQALDGVDSELKRVLDEFNISGEDRTAVESEKSSTKRIRLLATKIQSLESKKHEATGKSKDDLTNQINTMKAEQAKLVKDFEDRIKSVESEWKGKLTSSTIRSILAGKKYANADQPAEVNIELATILINKELQKVGAHVVNTDAGLVLKRLSPNEEQDWYPPTNEKLSFEQFVDGTLATNKLLAVTDPEKDKTRDVNGTEPPIIRGNGTNLKTGNFSALLEANLAEMKRQ